MTTDTRTEVHEARRIAGLWAGLLLAPAAFLISLTVGYVAVYPSCRSGSALPIHLIHAVCLLLAVVGVAIGWSRWQAEGVGWPDDAGGPAARSRFMAGLGVAVSGLFVVAILAQWVPTFTLHPCQ